MIAVQPLYLLGYVKNKVHVKAHSTLDVRQMPLRDEEAVGSNPPPRPGKTRTLAILRKTRGGQTGGHSLHAELASFWLKMVFIVSAPRVITGLSWCR
jgi:hypothetical protein